MVDSLFTGDGRFSKRSHFSTIEYFFGSVFFTEQLYCSCRMIFRVFFAFLNFFVK